MTLSYVPSVGVHINELKHWYVNTKKSHLSVTEPNGQSFDFVDGK